MHLDRDAQLPHADGLVVAGGHEAAALVHEGDGVHRAQVVVVLLRQGFTAGVSRACRVCGVSSPTIYIDLIC